MTSNYKTLLRKVPREKLIGCAIVHDRLRFKSSEAYHFYLGNQDKLGTLGNVKEKYGIDDLRKILIANYVKPDRNEVFTRLTTNNKTQPLPGKNKGHRGQVLEQQLGLRNCSDLTDFKDGELKTVTIGQTNAISSLGHMLEEIIDEKVSFENSKLYEKSKHIIWSIYDKKGNLIKNAMVSSCENVALHNKTKEDYNFIADEIRRRYRNGIELTTINGPNDILQIRTKASKVNGSYIPLIHKGVVLKDKYMAFYYKADYVKNLLN